MFIYTRESHPGERFPAVHSLADKLAHARAFARDMGMERPMLVDDIDGTLHRAYGGLPNMSFVLDRSARVVYKANWTDARTLDAACEQLVHELRAREGGQRLAPYTVEWAPKRINERAPFMEGLMQNGPTAVHEFMAAIEAVHGKKALREMEAWLVSRGLERREP
ncbi:MAG: hypothetical protein KC912_21370 [Proteobacteria bacterium]|nr:hypothetical protein [Pseudomonadota bacterium]